MDGETGKLRETLNSKGACPVSKLELPNVNVRDIRAEELSWGTDSIIISPSECIDVRSVLQLY